MVQRNVRGVTRLVAAALLSAAFGAVAATGTTSTSTATASDTTTNPGIASVTDRYAATFGTWAGSADNAESLLQGLHSGGTVTLLEPSSSTTETALTFSSPAQPMSYRNAYISLALAQHELALQGITQPTAQQIQTAMLGGSLTVTNGTTTKTVQMPGVLTLRAQGYGWGKIANTLGFKLGPVISGLNHTAPGAAEGGVTTASTTAPGRVGHGSESAGRSYGEGIVSALGAPMGSTGASMRASASSNGRGSDYGADVVNAAGQNGASGNAGGAGHGKAMGHL